MPKYTISLDRTIYGADAVEAKVVEAHYLQHSDGWVLFKDSENKVVAEVPERLVQFIDVERQPGESHGPVVHTSGRTDLGRRPRGEGTPS